MCEYVFVLWASNLFLSALKPENALTNYVGLCRHSLSWVVYVVRMPLYFLSKTWACGSGNLHLPPSWVKFVLLLLIVILPCCLNPKPDWSHLVKWCNFVKPVLSCAFLRLALFYLITLLSLVVTMLVLTPWIFIQWCILLCHNSIETPCLCHLWHLDLEGAQEKPNSQRTTKILSMILAKRIYIDTLLELLWHTTICKSSCKQFLHQNPNVLHELPYQRIIRVCDEEYKV